MFKKVFKWYWHRDTADRFAIGLVAMEGVALLADRFAMFGLCGSGWTALLIVGLVCTALLVVLLWFGICLLLRRRFHFGIRSLLLLAVAVAIPSGWLAERAQHARKQREIVEGILAAGGSVHYDHRDIRIRCHIATVPGLPSLLEWLGVDFVADVFSVEGGVEPPCSADSESSCPRRSFSNDDMKLVGSLPNLESLDLSETQVTDAGLEHLTTLTNLKMLGLNCTQVTDAGLEHLKGLTKLKWLHLSGTKVTDAGLQCLRRLAELEGLWLTDTQVTDAGLECLKGLANLKLVVLWQTQVTDKGVEALQDALPNCQIDWQ